MRISQVEFFSKKGRHFARAYIIGANSRRVPMPAREVHEDGQIEQYLNAITEANTTHEALIKVRGM